MRLFYFFLIFLVFVKSAFPCTCANINEEQEIENLKRQDAVFEGKVISIDEKGITEFSVKRSWKGGESSHISIAGGKDLSCGFNFEAGKNYTVVASGNPLKTSLCIRGRIESSKFSEILGAPKIFPEAEATVSNSAPAQGFLSRIWNAIVSFFA